jgi:MFS family permease
LTGTGPETPEARRLRLTAVAVLAVCFLLNMFGRGMGDTYIVFIRPIEQDFGWSRSQLTSVYSVYLLVGGFTAPLVGLVLDRFGPRLVYATGMIFLGLSFTLAGWLENLWQFYLLVGGMIGIGVGFTGMVPASGLMTRWFRAKLSTALGIAFSAVGMGALVFVPLAQYLITQFDWRMAYRFMGGAVLVVGVLAAIFVPWNRFWRGNPEYRIDPGSKAAMEGWTLRSASRTRMYWALVQVFFCTSMCMYTVTVQTVVYLVDVGFAPLSAATAFGFVGMLSVCSVAMSGFLSDRYGHRQTVTASFVGTGGGIVVLFAMTFFPYGILLGLYVLVFGLCQGMRGPIISSVATKYFAGPRVSTIYGTIYATNAVGAAIGALAGGVLHDLSGGYRAGFLFALVVMGFAVAPFWRVQALRDFK